MLRTDRNPFHHGTLGAVRSLGRAGVDVHVVADCDQSPVRASRYLSGLHTPPPPGASPAEIAAVLRRVAGRIGRPAVLIAMDDACAVAVGRARAELAPAYLLPDQPGELPARVADKAELAGVCAALDVPHPQTLVPDGAAEAARAAWRLGLPVVAKWSRPWAGAPGRRAAQHGAGALRPGGRGAVPAGGGGGQPAAAPGVPAAGCRPGLVLPRIDADRSGAVRAGGPGRKTRARPRGAGLTAVGRWTPNPRVRALAERVTVELGYRGVFDLDFRRCGTTGRYHLLDFNPRPGAQFRLFTDTAGLDVVRALHLDLTHRPLPQGLPRPGRVFVVENYAPLSALRPAREAQGGRELAWHARDDRAPGRALWALWGRHVGARLRDRVHRGRDGRPDTAPPARARVVRQASAPATDHRRPRPPGRGPGGQPLRPRAPGICRNGAPGGPWRGPRAAG
ncbi:hypothetical protein SVIOM342S_10555 [Streptomyces violaceorubidus]